jgi:opacity protein-like surface antigen
MKTLPIISVTLFLLSGTWSLVRAGEEKKLEVPQEIAVSTKEEVNHDWSLEVGTGVQWSNIRTGGQDGYTMIPGTITAALKLDEVSLDDFQGGFFRGYSEFLFQGFGYALTNSPVGESRILGVNVGPRYNFVQPGWKLVPYVQGLVGLGFADSNPGVGGGGNAHGLGQDFNFSFGVGAGVRYDFNDNWYLRAGAEYTHFSNAGLSDPGHENRPIDALGPMVALGFRF